MTAASPLDSLKPVAGRALQAALNHLLALDPDTAARLRTLQGKRVELEMLSPPLALAITVQDGKLQVGPVQRAAGASEADLGLRATLGGLLGQVPFLRASSRPPTGSLRINGDAELARTLQQLARAFDPDWDRPFASALGPIIGPQVARLLREALQASGKVARNIARDAAEFVTEESRDVIPKAELEGFNDDVDVLRDRAERLIARVSRLSAQGPRDP